MNSLLLRTAVKLIFPLVLIFSAYIAIKGHNEPGGGFIGGLMAAVAFLLYRMTHGRGALVRLLPWSRPLLIALVLGGGLAERA
ncbi:MAG: MnhB domain-containing protein, partial [Planctomycetota bacterium]